jgi:hypothetical protein
MGWVLTASGAIAGIPTGPASVEPRGVQSPQVRLERPEIVDATTGAQLRLTSRGNGAVQAALKWPDLDVRKVVQPNGDFSVRLAGHQDLVLLIRTGNRLRVSRNGLSAVVALDQTDEDGLEQAQQVLAGSRAMRAFRTVRSRLDAESLGSAPGVSIDFVDVLLGIIQGDPSVFARRESPGHGRLSRTALRVGPTCYGDYESTVVGAWGDFVQCCDDVRWYPGLQEVCAFSWLLQAESAWFRFIACSSIPLKAD